LCRINMLGGGLRSPSAFLVRKTTFYSTVHVHIKTYRHVVHLQLKRT